MKKLLFLSFLLPFLAKAQLPVTRSPTGVTVEDYRLYPILNFRIPPFADTTEANLSKGLDSLGTVINIRGTPRVYVRQISSGTVKKWGLVGDTTSIFVTQIGTGSPQIPLLYAVDGNLRSARLVPGVFTTPAMNLDSGVHIDLDTTGVGGAAYKQWIVDQYGPAFGGSGTNIYNSNGHITDDDRYLGGPLTLGAATKTLHFDSLLNFNVNESGTGNGITLYGHAGTSLFQVNQNSISGTVISPTSVAYSSEGSAGDSITLESGKFGVGNDTMRITVAPNYISIDSLFQSNDTTTFKPIGVRVSDGQLRRMDGWAGSGSGGGTATIQTITSGSSGTVTGSNYWVRFNPASALASYTLTLPASPTVGQSVTVIFGGTITAGIVVTAFTVAPNTSQSIIDNTAPAGSSVTADNAFEYLYVATNLWIRKKL